MLPESGMLGFWDLIVDNILNQAGIKHGQA
jgi:hypothetical protein